MFHMPGYVGNVSTALSGALKTLGVNEKIVLKRRKRAILNEYLLTMLLQVANLNSTSFVFGSRSEGSLTPGMRSDCDIVICEDAFNVIQDLSDWKQGKKNYLMIQDDTVSPGYCLLQRLRDDSPLPYNDEPCKHEFRDRTGRILLKNTYCHDSTTDRGVRHGPANSEQGTHGFVDIDVVKAFPCKTWPTQAKPWLDKQGVGVWPSNDMRRYCCTTGCFVVGVGSKVNQNEELEWRISTSLAERCLMFNLNITQIQCYVLMKMILKTFIKPQFGDAISSFMCKTVLFHCIENAHHSIWRETNLLVCLSLCLSALYVCVSDGNCPHFMIPQNNLMIRHILPENKPQILAALRNIVASRGRKLLEIACDGFGKRVTFKLNGLYEPHPKYLRFQMMISGKLLKITAWALDKWIKWYLGLFPAQTCTSHNNFIRAFVELLVSLVKKFNASDRMNRTACCLLAPWFCKLLGFVLASLNIRLYNNVSQEALTLISLGLNTDVSSGKLKLASMLFCTGDIQRTEIVLRNVEEAYNPNLVEPVCACYEYFLHPGNAFSAIAAYHEEGALKYRTAYCIYFLPCEINLVPKELKYEMFRSSEEDKAYRRYRDMWMDWAVVDALSYLYFLQYKTYGLLGRQENKHIALSSLVWTIENVKNLGHRETALNLLGQCMEQEGRPLDAFRYYSLSLDIRGRNNVAKIHICRLLFALINNQ